MVVFILRPVFFLDAATQTNWKYSTEKNPYGLKTILINYHF